MEDKTQEDEIYENVRETLVNQGVVFFGGYAISLYSRYMPRSLQKKLHKIADFDVLSNEPETTAEIVQERLKDVNVTDVKIIKQKPVGEIIPEHYEVKVGNDSVAFIYKPIACHSYNVLKIHKQKVKIATIDTMLSFYLAFLYADRPYYTNFSDRILCMSKFLFEVQQRNRLKQEGLLRRFSITCYGHQESVEEMRAEKAEKFKELKPKRGTKEFEEWFLNYRPDDKSKDTKGNKENTKDKDYKKDKKITKKDIETHVKPLTKRKKIMKNKKKQTMKNNMSKYSFNFWGKTKRSNKMKNLY